MSEGEAMSLFETTQRKDAGETGGKDAGGYTAGVSKHTDLRGLSPNVFIDGIYSIYNPQVGTTRQGKPFLKCLLRDATGEVSARLWSFEESRLAEIGSTGFVWIAGSTENYNGQIQLKLEQIKPIEVSEQDLAALLPTTKHDIDEMFAEVRRLLGSLEHPAMRSLADAYLDDEELMRRFRHGPAAVTVHHAWIGGLLEHTLQLMSLADAMLPRYPELNRDIVLMGLFLHDLGKTHELSWDRGFTYTTDGELIGHIVRGAVLLQFKAAVAARASGEKLPVDALRVLQHIILSHHGQPDHGAAKIPSTPEAIFVSQLDDLDAKTQIALTAVDRASHETGRFTDRVWALGTKLFRPDPLG
jgi:3'-5' exoribonuclease